MSCKDRLKTQKKDKNNWFLKVASPHTGRVAQTEGLLTL